VSDGSRSGSTRACSPDEGGRGSCAARATA
jgi:hypothetical protein